MTATAEVVVVLTADEVATGDVSTGEVSTGEVVKTGGVVSTVLLP